VARKQEKGETVTDKEIRSGEAAMAQKQADEALRENERQFRALFEQAAIGVAKVETATGQFVLVNQRYADIVGYSREELLSLDFQTITYPDDRLTDSLNMKRLASGQVREFTTEKRYRRKDGTQVWANLTVSALWNPGEPATYHMAMIVDITERKRVEEAEALRESEERYRTIYDQSPIAIELYDAAGTLVHANPAGLNLFGIKDVQAIRGFPLFADPNIDDEQKEKLHQGEAVRYQGPLDFERVKTLNLYPTTREGIIWLDVLITPLGNRADSISGFLMQVQDITEHKQAEEALRENEALYQSLVKVSPLSICRKDLAGRFTFANQRFLEALNLSLADLIGLTDFDLHPPELAEKYRRDDRAVMDSGQAREFIEERAVLGGESRVIQSYKTPIYDGAGKINGVQISFWDITERKQAETEKEALQAQLHQSQKMEAIGTLAGGVAHDFNNLLTGILGNIALIRGGLLAADPLLENLNAAETAARQAADLTQGLLTFGRSAMVLPVPMNIAAALDATLALLKQSLPATMEIVRDYEQTAWNVLMDQSQITQILLNLAVNARDAMKGKGTLTIRARNEVVGEEYVQTHPFARTGEFVHLSVTDTGPGIPREILEHLFEPFYTTKPVGSGTGLGLSIVYGAVKQAGGWITAESTEGAGKTAPLIEQTCSGEATPYIGQTCSGAIFDIYLPRCLESPPQSPPPTPPSVNVPGGTVLVVEDEPAVRTVAQALLTRRGYAVLTAPDGASALDVLRDHPAGIGLILLDMTMPGMTTDEIVQGVRALNPTLPILLNSGYTSNDAVRRMLEEGSVQGFLGKPYDLHQLVENVQKLISRG
jgi:PAS domain S-box-containing protein